MTLKYTVNYIQEMSKVLFERYKQEGIIILSDNMKWILLFVVNLSGARFRDLDFVISMIVIS